MNLDTIALVRKVDKCGMMTRIMEFPEQVMQAVEIVRNFKIPNRFSEFSEIVATGMGGSGIPGDFLRSLLKNDLPIPLFVNKSCTIPRFVDEQSLVFAVSYSGTTHETIAAFNAARRARAKIIGITSGATLGYLCKKYRVPCVLVPPGRQTRTSFGFLFFSILVILQRLGAIGDMTAQMRETVDVLRDTRAELGPDVPTRDNIAKSLALRLVGRLPVIYGVRDHTDGVALRWRQQFNENSKVLASTEAFPELNHNETVAFDFPRPDMYQIILLRDHGPEIPPIVTEGIELTKSLLKSKRVGFTEIWGKGASSLARLFSLTYVGDFTSLYLAVASGVDPTSVETIQRIRKALARTRSRLRSC